MSLIDRINRRIVGRLDRGKPRLLVEKDGVRVERADGDRRSLAFASLRRATVLHRDAYVGDAIALRLEFADGEAVEFAMDDPRWAELVAALDASGRLVEPSTVWQVRAIADGSGADPRELM